MPSWDAARKNSNSYSADVILQRVRRAAKRARNDNARKFERDGAVLSDPQPPFALVSCLLRSRARAKLGLMVVDFGGSLGSTYWQCAEILSVVGTLRWHVVEQPEFVKCGHEEFETANLRFFETIEGAAAVSHPDAIIFSSVLQYLDDPYDILERAVKLNPTVIVIDRTPVGDIGEDAFTIQYVPDDQYPVRLPFRIFGRSPFVDCLGPSYQKITEFAALDPDMLAQTIPVRFRGYLFEKTS